MPEEIKINFEEYKDKGLYLNFPDSSRLLLTRTAIESKVESFWKDPGKIDPRLKEAAVYQKCHFCPLAKDDICRAIYPVWPLLDIVDRYLSYDKVIAVFKREQDIIYVANTTMQDALKFISILSLIYYCAQGKVYWKYLFGINPLMSPHDIAVRLYLNIFLLHNGDKKTVDALIEKIKQEITISSQNQAARLNIACKNDAFLNAFVNTQIATEILAMDMEEAMKASFENFNKTVQSSPW